MPPRKSKPKARKVVKLGIYVPPNRIADIERLRDTVNFSQLFWQALDGEIRRQATGIS